jgi:hypothetical protein
LRAANLQGADLGWADLRDSDLGHQFPPRFPGGRRPRRREAE